MNGSVDTISAPTTDMHEHLSALPPHMVELVGGFALELAHVDMHPITPVGGPESGHTKIDFSKRITDPDFEEDTLEAGAVEAAAAGQEKLSTLLHNSSKFLNLAHQDLLAQGHNFEPPANEAVEQQKVREAAEQNLLFIAAKNMTITAAAEAKLSGHPDDAVQSLEALLLLESIDKSYPNTNRKINRTAINQGLGDQMLEAVVKAQDITMQGADYRVSSGARESLQLIKMASGKNFDHDFKNIRDLEPQDLAQMRFVLYEDDLDIMAVITAKNSEMSRDVRMKLLNYMDECALKETLVKSLQNSPNPEDSEDVYNIAESSKYNSFDTYLKYENPKAIFDAAQHLGLEVFEAHNLFGSRTEPSVFDTARFEGIMALKEAFPQHYETVMSALKLSNYPGKEPTYNPQEITKGLAVLGELNMADPKAIKFICELDSGVEEFTTSCQITAEMFSKFGIDKSQIQAIADSLGVGSAAFLANVLARTPDKQDKVEKMIIEAKISDVYMELYGGLKYPLDNKVDGVDPPELSQLPVLQERMLKIGISPELAQSIFKSWATYDAMALHNYINNEGFGITKTEPSRQTLHEISIKQANVFLIQLESIENFKQTYGPETTSEVIDTFGIYNFVRYSPAALEAQNQRWKKGLPAKDVIVNSRSDWNSYTGNQPVFKDGAGNESYVFEANSALETAKIAVNIGKHQRAHGREPDLRHFIVHGHGNSKLLQMGVNDEAIRTADYVEAAKNRQKIPKSEANDYKKHLGPNFSVILQSCSTAGRAVNGGYNLAKTISEQHGVEVHASDVMIHGLTIESDGSIKFSVDKADGDGSPVVYKG